MGFALTQAEHYLANRPDDFGPDDRQFITSSLACRHVHSPAGRVVNGMNRCSP
jgi:hypothetical protein